MSCFLINPYVFSTGVAWTPANTTTYAWYDFSDTGTVTVVSNVVSDITDKSGNSFTLSQGTSANRPAYTGTQNSLNVATFDGTNDVLIRGPDVPILQNVGEAVLLVASKANATASPAKLIFSVNTTGALSSGLVRAALEVGRTTNRFSVSGRRLDANSVGTATAAGAAGTTWQIQSGDFYWSNSDLFQYINGTLDGSNTSFQTSGNTENTTSSGIALGGNASSAAYFNGDIGEAFILASRADRQKGEGYLAWKWGLVSSLDAGHPYKSAPPTV